MNINRSTAQPVNPYTACDTFKITVTGASSHGSAPHLGHDAVVAAAAVIMNLQTFASRVNNPLKPLAVTIGIVKGGLRFNIIAGEALLHGSIRTCSAEQRAQAQSEIAKIASLTAEALGCTAQTEYTEPIPVCEQSEKGACCK